MAEKKLTRHQLKEDPLVTGAFRIRQYLTANRERILWGLGAVALVVFALFWFLGSRSEEESQSQALLTRAVLEVQSGQMPLALQDLRTLVEKHSSSRAGREGYYYLANAYFQLADYDQAEHYYGKFLQEASKTAIITPSAYAGLATCEELKGKNKEAAGNFANAVEASGKGSQTPDYLVGAIRAYAAIGDSSRARRLFARLKDEFPIYREQINQALLYMGIHGIYEYPE